MELKFDWRVDQVRFDSVTDQQNLEGDAVALLTHAVAPNATSALTYSATGLPDGLTIGSSTGRITGEIDTATAGTIYNVTVTATDGTYSADLTFNWDVPYLILDKPGDQTSIDLDEIELGLPGAGSPGATLTWSATGLPSGVEIEDSEIGVITGTIAYDASAYGPYDVTITLSDGSHSVEQSFLWNAFHDVLVNPGLQIYQPEDQVTLAVLASDPQEDPLTYDADGLPEGLSIDSDTGVISGTIDSGAGNAEPYVVTVSVTDGEGTTSLEFNFIVTTGAIVVTNPGGQTNDEGDEVDLTIEAIDSIFSPGDPGLSFTALGLPHGLTMDVSTGHIVGTIADSAADNGGEFDASIMVDDGRGNTGGIRLHWSIDDVNHAPVVSSPGTQVNTLYDDVDFQVPAYDSDGDALTYSATGLPDGLSIDEDTGEITGTLGESTPSETPYEVTVTVSDGVDSAYADFDIIVVDGAIVVDQPVDQANDEGDSVGFYITVSGDYQNPITYYALNLPDGLSIDEDTGEISGTVSHDAAELMETQQIIVRVWDNKSQSAFAVFYWDVANVNQPPDLSNPGTQYGDEADDISLPTEATDPDGDSLTYAAAGLPPGLSINWLTGEMTGTIDYNAAQINDGEYTVVLMVSDGQGHTTYDSFDVSVSNTNRSAIVEPVPLQLGQWGEVVSFFVHAEDPDGDTLHYSATGLPEGLTIDEDTGEISGTISSSASTTEPYEVIVTVSDSDEVSTVSFIYNIEENEDLPGISILPNETVTNDDDIVGIFDTGNGQASVDALWVLITANKLPEGSNAITLTLSLSTEMATISPTSVTLMAGGSAQAIITPSAEAEGSSAANDVSVQATWNDKLVGSAPFTIERVGPLQPVRAPYTPPTINRIPPRVKTDYYVTMSADLRGSKQHVSFQIVFPAGEFLGGIASWDTFQRIKEVQEGAGSFSHPLVGELQTTPEHKDEITIQFWLREKGPIEHVALLGASAPFSVAAYPYQVRDEGYAVLVGAPNQSTPPLYYWAYRYKTTYESDSGINDDLDEIRTMEIVNVILSTGLFVGGDPPNVQDRFRRPIPFRFDTIGIPYGPGTRAAAVATFRQDIDTNFLNLELASQYDVFADNRTGITQANPAVIRESGFLIGQTAFRSAVGYYLRIQKFPWTVGDAMPGVISEGAVNIPIE